MEKKEQECGTTVAFAAQHGFYSITFGLIPGWLTAQTNNLTLWTQKAKPTQSSWDPVSTVCHPFRHVFIRSALFLWLIHQILCVGFTSLRKHWIPS